MDIYRRRRITNIIAITGASVATFIGLFWLIWLLATLVGHGLAAIDLKMFTQSTPPPGSSGGLANAIVGSLMLTGLGVLIGAPLGVLAGTFLAEFDPKRRVSGPIRFVNDMLLSAPSIIIGVFAYAAVVLTTGHFSGYAGALALALIAIPVVVRTTEDMLRLVPNTLREAATALGAPQWKVTVLIAYRAAGPGIATGILLAVARITGETAPLLFTVLNNQFWSTDMSQPLANLPVVIFQYAMSPYEDWQKLAWGGALLITVSVLGLNILARTILRGRSTQY